MFNYQPLVVETNRTGTTTSLACLGEVDIHTVDRFASSVSDALQERPETLVLDLSSLDFLAITGAMFIDSALKQADIADIRLVVICKDAVERSLDLLGVEHRAAAPQRRTSLQSAMDPHIATERNLRRSKIRRGDQHKKAA